MAKMYCQWVGIILIVGGVLGLLLGTDLLGVAVRGLHTWIHLASGVILAYLGYRSTGVRGGAQTFGIIYTLVAILGFFGGGTIPILGFPVNLAYNLVHLVLGVAGLYTGFGQEQPG